MSVIHLNQIRATLREYFEDKIDLSDVSHHKPKQQETFFLTRALAAFAVLALSDITPEVASDAITDSSDDNGIDLVHYDGKERRLYVVQSKWSDTGKGTLTRGDAQKFITGFRDLLGLRYDRFNQKIQQRERAITDALNHQHTQIRLIVAYTGEQSLAADVERDFQDLLNELNSPTPIVEFIVLRQAALHGAIVRGIQGDPINVDVVLQHWGRVDEPYKAVYGSVAASDVAQWGTDYSPQIFSPNIRVFLDNTLVNEGIRETLSRAPEHFWYFNNGITALCRSANRKPAGGNGRDVGIFSCEDFSIINGAQTVGSLAQQLKDSPGSLERAKVQIRIVSLEDAPQDFGKLVTRYNNTQNRIDRREFVALDPQQERIRLELQIDGISYVYRSGEVREQNEQGFDLTEATIARTCFSNDVKLTAISRKEIGRLWDDIEAPPYRTLFNSGVTGPNLWRLVKAFRIIDAATELAGAGSDSAREKAVAYHGSRFIGFLVFHEFTDELSVPNSDLSEELEASLQSRAIELFRDCVVALEDHYPGAYIAHLFRNQQKCEHLANMLRSV